MPVQKTSTQLAPNAMGHITRSLLKDCYTQFSYYAELHRLKGTYEADFKAARNQYWADRIRRHLDGTP